jgi:aryl-alcohol dehydrogenase-like predicted oxidoreductase
MGMSAFYTQTSTEEQNIAVFHAAVNSGVTLFNTATFYGPLTEEGYGSNLRLIRKCLEGVDRSKIQLMVKVAMDTRSGGFVNRGTPEGIREVKSMAIVIKTTITIKNTGCGVRTADSRS